MGGTHAGWLARACESPSPPRRSVARCALKWVLSHDEVTTVVVGADDANQLRNSVAVLADPALSSEEQEVLERIKATEAFGAYSKRKRDDFK